MVSGEIEGQQGPHRQAGHEDPLTALPQRLVGPFHMLGPVRPLAAIHLLERRAVAGQAGPGDGQPGRVERLADQAHLGRRAGVAVDHQDAGRAAGQEKGRWVKVCVLSHRFPF